MVKNGGGSGLGRHPVAGSSIRPEVLRQKLDRDYPVQACIHRPVNDAHSPFAEAVQDAVVTDGTVREVHRLRGQTAVRPLPRFPHVGLWGTSPTRGPEDTLYRLNIRPIDLN